MSYADFGIHRFWKYSAFLQFLRCSFPRSNTSAKFHGYARTTVSTLKGCFTVGERKNIKKLMINSELVIE